MTGGISWKQNLDFFNFPSFVHCPYNQRHEILEVTKVKSDRQCHHMKSNKITNVFKLMF